MQTFRRSICFILAWGTLVSIHAGLLAQASPGADTIYLGNPSFEDIPRAGGSGLYRVIMGWQDCGVHRFPQESPPDIHPVPGAAWGVTMESQHGATYLGMVVRDDESWESVSQATSAVLKGGECYAFSVWLCKSEIYFSRRDNPIYGDSLFPFTRPAVLRIYGGNGLCSSTELLAESDPVSNTDWARYTFKLEPTQDHKYIMLEAFYKTPVLKPYNGHILVDNIAPIVRVPCSDEDVSDLFEPEEKPEPLIAGTSPPVSKPAPPPTASPAPKLPVSPPAKEPEPETVSQKYIVELDRTKLEKGKTIRIERLFFKADSSNIEEESYPVLDELAEFLKKYPEVVIEIGGHTNTIPSHEYCNTLSTKRAKSVMDFLIERGVPKRQLQYKGYGKTKPLIPDDTYSKTAQKRNQRVEIKVLSVG